MLLDGRDVRPLPLPPLEILPVNDLEYFDALVKPLVDLEEWESESESDNAPA